MTLPSADQLKKMAQDMINLVTIVNQLRARKEESELWLDIALENTAITSKPSFQSLLTMESPPQYPIRMFLNVNSRQGSFQWVYNELNRLINRTNLIRQSYRPENDHFNYAYFQVYANPADYTDLDLILYDINELTNLVTALNKIFVLVLEFNSNQQEQQ